MNKISLKSFLIVSISLLFSIQTAQALELSLESNKAESGTVGYVDIDLVFKKCSLTTKQRVSFKEKIKEKEIFFDGKTSDVKIIFTGMIDELFGDKFGRLPYRSIDLGFETLDQEYFQEYAVVNYPNEHNYTRITEFKHIHPAKTSKTTILKEYPQAYIRDKNTPYYPMFTDENQERYNDYASYAKNIPNLILVGRLAEYKYYDMDDIVARALEVYEDIISL